MAEKRLTGSVAEDSSLHFPQFAVILQARKREICDVDYFPNLGSFMRRRRVHAGITLVRVELLLHSRLPVDEDRPKTAYCKLHKLRDGRC